MAKKIKTVIPRTGALTEREPATPEGIRDYILDNDLLSAFLHACGTKPNGCRIMEVLLRYKGGNPPRLELYGHINTVSAAGFEKDKYIKRTEKTGKWVPAYLVIKGSTYSVIASRRIRPYEDPEAPGIEYPDIGEPVLKAVKMMRIMNLRELEDFIREGSAHGKPGIAVIGGPGAAKSRMHGIPSAK